MKIRNAEDEAIRNLSKSTYHNFVRKDDRLAMKDIDDVYNEIRKSTNRLPTPSVDWNT